MATGGTQMAEKSTTSLGWERLFKQSLIIVCYLPDRRHRGGKCQLYP